MVLYQHDGKRLYFYWFFFLGVTIAYAFSVTAEVFWKLEVTSGFDKINRERKNRIIGLVHSWD